ncbi:NADP(+)-dependent dehydrogenase [Apiospora kogelbergensis]|uniref:NADP(+)-dependent dehydrogenase n=1 Tax=Apiospora kogelbergensis TaxID=1337665 RepID=UPI0031327512
MRSSVSHAHLRTNSRRMISLNWHNDVYPAIDYKNPSLRHEGQTVVITGAGSGIAREAAAAFATAGAKRLVLVGRTEAKLQQAASDLAQSHPAVEVQHVVADVADAAAVRSLAASLGVWDVLVQGAGYINSPAPAAQAGVDDYWKAYEINVKSFVLLVKALLPKAAPGAAVLALVGGSLVFPTSMLVGLSGYLVSKMALAKTIEFLALENPDVFFAAVHPGMVDTDIFRRSGAIPDMLAMDTPKLFAGFSLWLTSPEAKFLSGRFVWANWDVEELKQKKDEIMSSTKLTFNLEGFPFASS